MRRPLVQKGTTFVHSFSFSGMVGEICAAAPHEVVPALKLMEERVAAGLHAAGFVSYEAAGALNPHLTTRPAGEFPLLWFGLFESRSPAPLPAASAPFAASQWQPSVDEQEYSGAIAAIRELIAAGDCYQVNFTMRQRFRFSGCPLSYFAEMIKAQPTPYSSFLESGRYRILSASPELFFSLDGGVLTTRPMKGTAARGRWCGEDEARKARLKESPKDLAENLMIVDLLRNDMGMVSEVGSVKVASLFDVETYPTVHQMTSTITSRLKEEVGTAELMEALFPCGSITGAPKRRSMEIISELEREPRGLYTGCIGYLSPGKEALFSVAIRTAVIDLETGRGEIGIGSGITYDSAAQDEYAESLSKGCFAHKQTPDFHLIESLLYDDGYFLLERHMERLARSAAYFAFPLDLAAVLASLEEFGKTLLGKQKVRFLLYKDGATHLEAAPIPEAAPEATVCFAKETAASSDRFLYHKTSLRRLYSEAAASRPDVDETLFLNERGEVTEGVNSNVVVRIGDEMLTPPLASGLLPGVFREELLATGIVNERVLTRADLEQADEIFLINSVRKWRKGRLVQ